MTDPKLKAAAELYVMKFGPRGYNAKAFEEHVGLFLAGASYAREDLEPKLAAAEERYAKEAIKGMLRIDASTLKTALLKEQLAASQVEARKMEHAAERHRELAAERLKEVQTYQAESLRLREALDFYAGWETKLFFFHKDELRSADDFGRKAKQALAAAPETNRLAELLGAYAELERVADQTVNRDNEYVYEALAAVRAAKGEK